MIFLVRFSEITIEYQLYNIVSHMLHVWYICLQNWVIYGVNVGVHIPAPWFAYGFGKESHGRYDGEAMLGCPFSEACYQVQKSGYQNGNHNVLSCLINIIWHLFILTQYIIFFNDTVIWQQQV